MFLFSGADIDLRLFVYIFLVLMILQAQMLMQCIVYNKITILFTKCFLWNFFGGNSCYHVKLMCYRVIN